jgi:predicted alpha/beta hydrolase
MIAPVLSQPSSSWSASAIGIPQADWDNAVKRSRDQDIPVLAFRFTGDRLCKKARFDALRAGFGERFRAVEVEGLGHSVLTMDYAGMKEADRARVWDALIGFLGERLK